MVHDMELVEATLDDVQEVAKTSISRGLKALPPNHEWCYALKHDGVVLGVGAIRPLTPNAAIVWIDLAEAARDHMIVVYRLLKDFVEAWLSGHEVVRLMATIEPDFAEAIRLV